ncbi:hypothetical protein T459_24611 [Capsicum annuum]|uniref:Aminotransferase-like plant mobile domain-containing protein n=1 Tax=Capsicum annuum TaxID=4072 RepID=A0A2G2YID9_CAPAN|nr:hypothetical protein T459_24611 [Capsicum annuum]
MMKNPHIMAKAESELRQVYTEKKIYDEENVETLTYLKLVVKEALRLHLPVPFIGPRECREKTNIKGYTIPFKTRVLVNAWTLARDPESWNNPERFTPQRFENSSVHFIGNHFELISFGVGRRICLVFLQITYQDKATQTDIIEDDALEKIFKTLTTLSMKVDSMSNEIEKLKTNEDKLKSVATNQLTQQCAELCRSEDIKISELEGDIRTLRKTHNVYQSTIAGIMTPPTVHSGPFISSVLLGQIGHRSEDIWNNGTCDTLTCHRYDGDFWDYISRNPLHERDVAILYGLPVDGLPVTGIDLTLDPADWQTRMVDLLGWAPIDIDRGFQGGRLLMTSLIKHITNLRLIIDASSEIDVQQRVRLYLLWIIGGMLAVDTSGNKVKLMYLHLLTDLSKVGQYAWGAATLAILYRYLCHASQKGIRVIGDFLPLLQVWIYERILPLRLQRDPDLLVVEWLISILLGSTRARVWSNGLCHDTEAPHLLYLFRDQLDLLMEHQPRMQLSGTIQIGVVGERGRGRIEAQYPCGDEYVEPRPQPRRRGRRWEEIPNYDRGEDAGTQISPVHDHVSSDRPSNSFEQHFRGIAKNIHASSLNYLEFTDSDFYGHSPIIPDPNPRRIPPIDPVPFMLDLEYQVDDNGIELESHVDDNGENTLGVGSRRGGRPRGRPPGRSRFQNAPAIRRNRPDEIDGGEPAHPHMLRPRANIHPRGCGTH